MHLKIKKLLCEMGAADKRLWEEIAALVVDHIGHEKLEEIFKHEDEEGMTHAEAHKYLKDKHGGHKWDYDEVKNWLKKEGFDYSHHDTTPEEMYLLMNKHHHDHKEIHGMDLPAEKAKKMAMVYLRDHEVEDLLD